VTAGAIAALLSAAALTTLAGCGGSGTGSGDPDESGTGNTQAAGTPPPGKYQTLPEPCGSVSSPTLHDLLPTSSDYAGTAMITFDTDRRVGCKWTGMAQDANRSLSIDFERVVSYDPSVSDEDKAKQDYEQKAAAAHIPDNAPAPDDSASVPQPGQSVSPSEDSGGDTSPRRVGGVGDEAYLDDSLAPDGDGSREDVTMVFRTSNVLVTIEFDQWSTATSQSPSSVDLQLGAHGLAQQLAKAIAQ
jgi:hypothetical protein